MSQNYLYRSLSQNNSNTWTYSLWYKPHQVDDQSNYVLGFTGTGGQQSGAAVSQGTNERIYLYNGSVHTSTEWAVDRSAWYHMVIKVSSGSVSCYINNKLVLNGFSYQAPASGQLRVGDWIGGSHAPALNMTDVYWVDGQALDPSVFAHSKSYRGGEWYPKSPSAVDAQINSGGGYGTNGFRLLFTNPSDLGEDTSGNNNDFTIAGTMFHSNDGVTNSFATHHDKDMESGENVYLNGLRVAESNNTRANMGFNTGKWYAEFKIEDEDGVNHIGVARMDVDKGHSGWSSGSFALWREDGKRQYDGVQTSGYADYNIGDWVSVLVDLDSNPRTITWWKNGVAQSGLTNLTLNNEIAEAIDRGEHMTFITRPNPSCQTLANFGQGIYVTSNSGNGYSDTNGLGKFQYQPPSGYMALCTKNLESQLSTVGKNPSDYFGTLTYSGTGSYGNTKNFGFKPDSILFKAYSGNEAHYWRWYNSCHSETAANPYHLNYAGVYNNFNDDPAIQFDSDGFTMVAGNGHNGINKVGTNYVAYGWTCSGAGSQNISSGNWSGRTNPNTGFCNVRGEYFAGTQIPHNFGKKVDFAIFKEDASNNYYVYHSGLSNQTHGYLYLETADAEQTYGSTMWSANADNYFQCNVISNSVASNDLAMLWTSIEGYSKFGIYQGNMTAGDGGPFIYTGFRPALVIRKKISGSGNWLVQDNRRPGYNNRNDNGGQTGNYGSNYRLLLNSSNMQGTAFQGVDFHSNGFHAFTAESDHNEDGATYIYCAWAEMPMAFANGRVGYF
jgi:hypothetical protein